MPNILVESPFQFITDNSGRPLINGKIYVGLPGQNAQNFPQSVWFDVAGTIPATQPIRTNQAGQPCDVSGNPQRLFTAGPYSLLITDQNDAEVESANNSLDGFYGVIASDLANNTDPTKGSDLVGYILQVGATGTTVHDKLERVVVDIKDFGAVGNGVANDKAAFDAAVATGRSILLPAGNYNVPSGNYGSSRFYSFDGATCTNSTVAIVDPLANSLAVGTEATFPCVSASLPFGWLPEDGSTLNRSVYPQLWAFANASGNIVDEVNKPANPGSFGRGNGTTTFSLPDKRGTNQGFADASKGLDATFVLGKVVTVTAASAAPGISVRSVISTPAIRAFAGSVNQGSIDIQALQAQVTAQNSYFLKQGVAQSTVSGTSIDFTAIPSAVKRVTFTAVGISTNGTSAFTLQIGTSAGVDTSGYASGYNYFNASIISGNTGGGLRLEPAVPAATASYIITALLTRVSGNTWTLDGKVYRTDGPGGGVGLASKTLSGELDRVRLTTSSGTETFDAGIANIMWEIGS